MPIKLYSHAKVNLGLYIKFKRTDGYHELETLMQELDFCDTIELFPSDQMELWINGVEDKNPNSNLIIQAIDSIKKVASKMISNYRIDVEKKIPIGSGLGGGSSNAVCILNYFWEHFCEGLDKSILNDLASSLGSDTNFFIDGGFAKCSGRGEKVKVMESCPLYYNLISPRFSCMTPIVFKQYTFKGEERNLDHEWQRFLERKEVLPRNDLLQACQDAYPDIKKIMKKFKENNKPVSLSGSGSTLFRYYESAKERDSEFSELKTFYEDILIVKAKNHNRKTN